MSIGMKNNYIYLIFKLKGLFRKGRPNTITARRDLLILMQNIYKKQEDETRTNSQI